VRHIYLHDLNADGTVDLGQPNTDMREFFFNLWRNRGLRNDQIESKWRKWTAEQKRGAP
jgi:hypothetical protein